MVMGVENDRLLKRDSFSSVEEGAPASRKDSHVCHPATVALGPACEPAAEDAEEDAAEVVSDNSIRRCAAVVPL